MKVFPLPIHTLVITATVVQQAFSANKYSEINDDDSKAIATGTDASAVTARITIQTSEDSNEQPLVLSVNVPRTSYDDVGPELVSHKLSDAGSIDIYGATIEVDDHQKEHDHATCFFWRDELKKRRETASSRWGNGDSFVSYPFSSPFTVPKGQEVSIFQRSSVLQHPISSAERLYCYDGSRERKDKAHATVLLENARGNKELLRIPVSDSDAGTDMNTGASTTNSKGRSLDSASSALHMYSRHPELGVDVAHAALLYDPRPLTYCTLYPEDGVDADESGQKISGAGYLLDFLNPLRISPFHTIARIQCRN